MGALDVDAGPMIIDDAERGIFRVNWRAFTDPDLLEPASNITKWKKAVNESGAKVD